MKQLVKKLNAKKIEVEVPSSKSILARALVLAAFTDGDTLLRATSFGEDTRSMLACLKELGIPTECSDRGITVHGNAHCSDMAVLDVGDAGTAARFLTAVLALRGGEYEFHASAQMTRRPMEILPALESAGVKIEPLGTSRHFPFRMCSEGFREPKIEVEARTSTQYASGLMLAAATGDRPFTVTLREGTNRTGYIRMTLSVISAFGGTYEACGNRFTVRPVCKKPTEYTVEPDVSAACYFFAAARLTGTEVFVKDLGETSIQGDMRFLRLLEEHGLCITHTDGGTSARAESETFSGFDVDAAEFSDQTLTLAALAPFAESPTRIRNIAHIRGQECDRVRAIEENLSALGVPVRCTEDTIEITPAPVRRDVTVKTYSDHRVAMAFSLIGLKTGGIMIDDADCTKKTFPGYFSILDRITRQA